MRCFRMPALLLAILAAAACAAQGTPTAQSGSALFYAKNGSIYVSYPAGTPGRKLTDGPTDTEPAPSPDGSRLAFIRKASRNDYGGELWVLGLAADTAPAGPPRRLVDPADLGPNAGGEPPKVGSPRWSPTGDRIAFLRATPTPAGSLRTAAADTGAVIVSQQPPWVDKDYAWAPDGSHIAWVEGRSDVRPAAVGVAAVGGPSIRLAEGTNASSVAYGDGGATVIFTNPDTTDPVMFPKNPFALRDGGIYSVPAAGGTATPTPLFTGRGSYADVAVLADGALAFTECSPTSCGPRSMRSIEVLAPRRSAPEKIAETPAVPAPAWSPDGVVAYVGGSADRPLMIMDRNDHAAKKVDVDIDIDLNGAGALAWGLKGRRQTGG